MLSTQAEREKLIKCLLGAKTNDQIDHWLDALTPRRQLSEEELTRLLPLLADPSFGDDGRKRLISLLGKHINVAVRGLDDPRKEIILACLTCLTSVRKQDFSKVRDCVGRVTQLRDEQDPEVSVEADRLLKRFAAMDNDAFNPRPKAKGNWFTPPRGGGKP